MLSAGVVFFGVGYPASLLAKRRDAKVFKIEINRGTYSIILGSEPGMTIHLSAISIRRIDFNSIGEQRNSVYMKLLVPGEDIWNLEIKDSNPANSHVAIMEQGQWYEIDIIYGKKIETVHVDKVEQ